MADTVIAAKLTADNSEAINSVRNFKQELKLAQQEVITLSEKFGATSKEAAAAAQKAAALADSIGDAKSLVDAFNPDTKMRAFGASINTVVGGFTALQGVMGLLGVESEETQKALLKVQSALAISQGFAQLQEGVQTFKNLGAVIQSTTLFQRANAIATNLAAGAMRLFGVQTTATATSMNVLKGAIIATGIGALVIVLGLAAQAMGFFSDSSDDAAESQDQLKQKIEGVNESLQAQTNFFANEEKLEVARAKRRGASEDEVFQIQQKYRRLNYDATIQAHEKVRGVDEAAAAKLLESVKSQNIAGQVAQIDHETKMIEIQKKKAEEATKMAVEARKKMFEELAKEQERQGLIELKRIDGLQIEIPKTQEQIQIENTVTATHKAFEDKQAIWLQESDARTGFYTAEKDRIKELEEKERAAYENRKTLLQSTGNLFNALGDIVGKQTAAGKALGIAQATINTYIGATEVLRAKSVLPEPIGTISKIINVAAIIATGIAAVKNIVKTNVPGSSGGGTVSTSGLTAPPPLVPERAQQNSTSLDQQSLNALNNATTRSFVLESDITNNQEKITRLNRAARLGG